MEHAILPSDGKPQDGMDSPIRDLTPFPSEGTIEMFDNDDAQQCRQRQRTNRNDASSRPSNEKLLVRYITKMYLFGAVYMLVSFGLLCFPYIVNCIHLVYGLYNMSNSSCLYCRLGGYDGRFCSHVC